MKFPHMVNHNGIYYPAGADVPIEVVVKSVELTDEVPDGSLQEDVFVPEPTKRGRKPKEAQ